MICSNKQCSSASDQAAVRNTSALVQRLPASAQPPTSSQAWSGAWPSLKNLGLTPHQQASRAGSIGGSDANAILSGSENRILRLWQEKRGEAEAEDLSSSVAVMLGCWTEAFNR